MNLKPVAIAAGLALVSVGAAALESSTPPTAVYRSAIPAAQRRAFFGELHLHTAFSLDAWGFGARVTPEQAFEFNSGWAVKVPAFQVADEEGLDATKDVMARRA